MAILEVEHIKKKFGKTDVLKDISFSLEQGEVLSIIGSSGSGKTTLLRCLNFLEMPDNGVIRVKDEILLDTDKPETLKESEVRKKRLHFGLVFQSFNLFPQYTALQNVMLARELLAKERKDGKHKMEITDNNRHRSDSSSVHGSAWYSELTEQGDSLGGAGEYGIIRYKSPGKAKG